ncbi:MAG: hypothetical protein NZ585_10820 [Chloracidobacterium sp.]|nr:hypothetical protein [Chloracidobacterium sp.]MDW8217705.1 hypothetical protein [Acidobacteriota bacterium]
MFALRRRAERRDFPVTEAPLVSKHKAKDEKPKEEKLKGKRRKSAAPTIFENVVEQATERWEQLVHNPRFAAALATALEQPVNLAHRVQELVSVSLRTMNIPTREDYKKLSRQLDAIADQLDAIRDRLEALTEQTPTSVPPAYGAEKARSKGGGHSRKKKGLSAPAGSADADA